MIQYCSLLVALHGAQYMAIVTPGSVSTVLIFPLFLVKSSSCAAMRLLLPVALLLWVVTCYNVAASALGPMRTFLTTFTIPPDVQPEQELVRSSRCLPDTLYIRC
jgi:ABC-type multidrug transport system permease subunit